MTTVKAPVWTGPPALRDSLVPIDSLEPWPGNPRIGDVDAIAASLGRFGQVRPILVRGSRIVADHHVAEAARRLGWSHVAVLDPDFPDETEARAYLLADNRTAELGSTDDALLVAQLEALDSLAGTGFSDDDLADLQAQLEALRSLENPRDPDDAPPPPVEARSRVGEVYELGPHRLVCGDATDPDVLAVLAAGASCSAVWTDPPYGVDYVGKTKRALTIANDGEHGLRRLVADSLAAASRVVQAGSPFYMTSPAGPRHLDFLLAVEEAGWSLHETLIWVKDSMVLGHADYHYRHEPILYGWLPGPGRSGRGNHQGTRWYGDNAQTSVLEVPRPKRSEEHPTMKPVELVERCVLNSTRPGDLVLDMFGGSGSTLVACDRQGRRALLVELDPVYCDVIRRRYADYADRPELAP